MSSWEEREGRRKLDLDARPLPVGWDCKWDATNNRFFFMNHATRRTTWDDPRSSASPAILNKDPYEELKAQFPSVPEPIVRATIVACGPTDTAGAAKRLREMGYKSGQPAAAKSESIQMSERKFLGEAWKGPNKSGTTSFTSAASKSTSTAKSQAAKPASAAKKPSAASAAKTTTAAASGTKKPAATKAKKTEPAKQPKPTAAMKKKLLSDFKRQFPDFEEDLIKMVLEASDYNRATALALIEETKSDSSRSTGGGSSAASRYPTYSPPASTFSPEPEPSFQAPELDQISFPELPTLSSISGTSLSSMLGERSTLSFSSGGKMNLSSFLGAAQPSKPAARTEQKVRHKPVVVQHTTRIRRPDFGTDGFVSSLREPYVGPDPLLAKGSNPALLSSVGVAAQGPDPSNRCGPQSRYRTDSLIHTQGSSGAAGPSPSNYCGPRAENYSGPSLAIQRSAAVH